MTSKIVVTTRVNGSRFSATLSTCAAATCSTTTVFSRLFLHLNPIRYFFVSCLFDQLTCWEKITGFFKNRHANVSGVIRYNVTVYSCIIWQRNALCWKEKEIFQKIRFYGFCFLHCNFGLCRQLLYLINSSINETPLCRLKTLKSPEKLESDFSVAFSKQCSDAWCQVLRVLRPPQDASSHLSLHSLFVCKFICEKNVKKNQKEQVYCYGSGAVTWNVSLQLNRGVNVHHLRIK